MLRLPYSVRCIKEYKTPMYPDLDFGTLGKVYDVLCIIPNGHYYVLRGIGEPGEPNYLLNMDRFEPEMWNFEYGE